MERNIVMCEFRGDRLDAAVGFCLEKNLKLVVKSVKDKNDVIKQCPCMKGRVIVSSDPIEKKLFNW